MEPPVQPFALIGRNDERYPALLREIHDPPAKLYVRGNVEALQQPQLAIVGSRRASLGAVKLTQLIARQLCSAGLSICSGLAQGVDGAAHRGALDAGGITVGVVGTGVDVVYPRQHKALVDEIVPHGCIVSEFPPGTPARPGHFPQRNRIISGMAAGVLVVEAAERSGSLITARLAMEQGREVFALPWSLLHEGGNGCLRLIRDGARMVLGVEDILEEVAHLVAHVPRPQGLEAGALSAQAQAGLPERDMQLLTLMGDRTCSIDELVTATGWAVGDVMAAVSAMEVSGTVVQMAGGYCRA